MTAADAMVKDPHAAAPEARPRPIRFRGKSYMAFVLAPDPPIADWLAELDSLIKRSSGFFASRPVVLDLTGVGLSSADIAHLIGELQTRGIRILGVEGVEPVLLGPDLPPLLKGGRVGGDAETDRPARDQAETPRRASLLIDKPVRSGQTVYFPDGDVIVVGAVSSGAEVVAGGSIHVYGALRGRAMAGANGDTSARIFCRRIEAELLAIAGFYRTADELESDLHGRAVQAWLDGDTMLIAALE